MLDQQTIDQARNIDIFDVASSLGIHVVKRTNSHWQCICPIHDGSSFYIYGADARIPNTATCYAGCSPPGGNKIWSPITLYMEVKKVDFHAAVREMLGIQSSPVTPAQNFRSSRKRKVKTDLNKPTPPIPIHEVEAHHKRLMTTPQGHQALTYLQSRHIYRHTVLRWKLGLTNLFEGTLDWLDTAPNPYVSGLSDVLVRFREDGLSLPSQHDIFRRLIQKTLTDKQVQWLAKRLDVNRLIENYGRLCHFNSFRITIPVWADGPPQDGSGHCHGLRYRYVPNLTPQPPIHIGCILVNQQISPRRKYSLLEILPGEQYLVQPRHKPAEPKPEPQVMPAHLFNMEVTKCWGTGSVKTLAANCQKDKHYAIAVEGEMDLLALDQLLLAHPLHSSSWLISSTNGAGNFPSEWLSNNFWKPFSRIMFAYDHDNAGNAAIEKLQTLKLQIESCPVPSGKDLNEWLINNHGHISPQAIANWIDIAH
jgi:Toprim-like